MPLTLSDIKVVQQVALFQRSNKPTVTDQHYRRLLEEFLQEHPPSEDVAPPNSWLDNRPQRREAFSAWLLPNNNKLYNHTSSIGVSFIDK
jgi:hypothetical protein